MEHNDKFEELLSEAVKLYFYKKTKEEEKKLKNIKRNSKNEKKG